MEVVKRDGRREPVRFDKITARIKKLAYGLDTIVDVVEVAQKVCMGVYHGVETSQLDDLAAETAAYMSTRHHDYSLLASRIAVSNLHKNTTKSFGATMERLHAHVDARTGEAAPLVSREFVQTVRAHANELDAAIIYDRDFSYNYFAFKTLERSYLHRVDGRVVERPQHMLMRVAVCVHGGDVAGAVHTYELLSLKYFTHASPTLFNAGAARQQLSSCFLLTMREDSIEGIYDTLKRCALISKGAGGIGLAVHNVRASGSYVRGTHGVSNGMVPMLRVFNDTARYVDQGGGKRRGAFAIYLEPWHADVLLFLELRKNHGKDENRARDLFYALWVPDLFMRRVEADAEWTLLCPNEAPGLADVHGAEFDALYERYERERRGRRRLKARRLWFAILEAQIETGTPYMLYKDTCNRHSNQRHLGTLRGSNLCTEIVQFTAPDEIAVCNLASIALPRFVVARGEGDDGESDGGDDERSDDDDDEDDDNDGDDKGGGRRARMRFDHEALRKVVHVVTRNLNRVIDVNHYPLREAEQSNRRHRPIGIGVQGLADAFLLLRMPFDSARARRLNTEIFETLYFAALEASVALAAQHGAYESYAGSPLSRGELHFDGYGDDGGEVRLSGRWDWAALRRELARHGARNSLLVAPMPTASTSQILGNHECFEPYTSNLYTRRVLAGEFTVVNQHLVRDLQRRRLWNERVKDRIIAASGSVQALPEVPPRLKRLYRTVWEVSQRSLLDMAAQRGAFIDQSQSLNVYIAAPSVAKLSSMHFYGWKRRLKTGMYYLRTRPAVDAIKFTVDPSTELEVMRMSLAARNAVGAAAATAGSGSGGGADNAAPRGAASLSRSSSSSSSSTGASQPPRANAGVRDNVEQGDERDDGEARARPRAGAAGAPLCARGSQSGDCEACGS